MPPIVRAAVAYRDDAAGPLQALRRRSQFTSCGDDASDDSIEDLAQYYAQRQQQLQAPRFESKNERDRVALEHRSCLIFPAIDPESDAFQLRLKMFELTHHRVFEIVVVLLIFANCVFLALDDPTLKSHEKPSYLRDAEYFFTACFTLELLLKVYAQGFIWHKGSYLRSGWNILDFIIVTFSVLSLMSSLEDITAMRTLRVLRPLRSINGIEGLKNIVNGLLHSLQKLVNVLALSAIVFSIFGILGVQLWSGRFVYRCEEVSPTTLCGPMAGSTALNTTCCHLTGHPDGACCFDFTVADSSVFAIESVCTAHTTLAGIDQDNCRCRVDREMYDRDAVDFATFCNPGASSVDMLGEVFGATCPDGYACVNTKENPNMGYTSFDHFGWAVLAVFQVLTLEGWVDIMYIVQDVFSDFGVIYFVLLVLLGSFFLLNLALAVINEEFDKISRESQEIRIAMELDEAERKELEIRRLLLEAKRQLTHNKPPSPTTSGATKRSSVYQISPKTSFRGRSLANNLAQAKQLPRASGMVTSASPKTGSLYPGRKSDNASPANESLPAPGSSTQRKSATPSHRRSSSASVPAPLPPLSQPDIQIDTGGEEAAGGGAGAPPAPAAADTQQLGRPLAAPRQPSVTWTADTLDIDKSCEDLGPDGEKEEKDKGKGTKASTVSPNADVLAKSVTTVRRLSASGHAAEPPPLPRTGSKPDFSYSTGAQRVKHNDPRERRSSVEMSFRRLTEQFESAHYLSKSQYVLLYWSKARWACWHVASHRRFTWTIVFIILLNTIIMAVEHHDQPEQFTEFSAIMNIILTMIFAVEMIIKLMASGFRGYVKDHFNVLDGFVVVVSVLEIILGDSSGISVLRALRLLRVLKLLKNFKELRKLVEVILGAVRDTGYLNLIILLYLFCAALVGMQFFGGRMFGTFPEECEDYDLLGSSANCTESRPRATFDSFYRAILTVFQVLTRDDWVNVMWAAMRATHPLAAVYFVVLVICGDFVILNLFLAILIQSFDQNMRINIADPNADNDGESEESELEMEEEPPPPEPDAALSPGAAAADDIDAASKASSGSSRQTNATLRKIQGLIEAQNTASGRRTSDALLSTAAFSKSPDSDKDAARVALLGKLYDKLESMEEENNALQKTMSSKLGSRSGSMFRSGSISLGASGGGMLGRASPPGRKVSTMRKPSHMQLDPKLSRSPSNRPLGKRPNRPSNTNSDFDVNEHFRGFLETSGASPPTTPTPQGGMRSPSWNGGHSRGSHTRLSDSKHSRGDSEQFGQSTLSATVDSSSGNTFKRGTSGVYLTAANPNGGTTPMQLELSACTPNNTTYNTPSSPVLAASQQSVMLGSPGFGSMRVSISKKASASRLNSLALAPSDPDPAPTGNGSPTQAEPPGHLGPEPGAHLPLPGAIQPRSPAGRPRSMTSLQAPQPHIPTVVSIGCSSPEAGVLGGDGSPQLLAPGPRTRGGGARTSSFIALSPANAPGIGSPLGVPNSNISKSPAVPFPPDGSFTEPAPLPAPLSGSPDPPRSPMAGGDLGLSRRSRAASRLSHLSAFTATNGDGLNDSGHSLSSDPLVSAGLSRKPSRHRSRTQLSRSPSREVLDARKSFVSDVKSETPLQDLDHPVLDFLGGDGVFDTPCLSSQGEENDEDDDGYVSWDPLAVDYTYNRRICPRCQEIPAISLVANAERRKHIHAKLCPLIQLRRHRRANLISLALMLERMEQDCAAFTKARLEGVLADFWAIGMWLERTPADFQEILCTFNHRKPDDVGMDESPLQWLQFDFFSTSVTSVIDPSPLHEAGLRKDDVLLKANGRAVVTDAVLAQEADATPPGDQLVLTVKKVRQWSGLRYLCMEELRLQTLTLGEEVFGGALVGFVTACRPEEMTTNGGYSLFLFGPTNGFRMMCYQCVKSPWFEKFILLCIFLSSMVMVLENPRHEGGEMAETLEIFNHIFTGIFVVEMCLKLVSFGLWIKPKRPLNADPPYLRDSWNILDGAIVLVAVLSTVLKKYSFLKVLRTFRALRPLRVISRNRGLRMVVITLLRTIASIGNVVMITLIVFLVFGILGVQLFAGKLYYCNDPMILVRQACVGFYPLPDGGLTPRKWQTDSFANFDDLGRSMLTLFEVSTLELWTTIMYRAIDGRSYNYAPKRDANIVLALFFVLFVIVGSFFILNLFVGFVLFNFNKVKAEEDGTGFNSLTEEQKLWLETQTMMLNFKPVIRPQEPKERWRLHIYLLVTSFHFEMAIAVSIALNTILMMMDDGGEGGEYHLMLDIGNYIFSGVFLFEALLKIAAFKLTYFKDTWNRFDFFLVLLSIVQAIMLVVDRGGIGVKGYVLRVLRVFRVMRVLRLVKSARDVRILLETVAYSLPHIANIGAFLCLLFFIYAVLGVNMFAKVKRGEFLNAHANYESFPRALLLLIRMVTGENWNGVMHETMAQPPNCEPELENCGTALAPLYYLTFLILATFILTNLFVAIVLDTFRTTILIEKSNLRMQDLHKFIETWARFDPEATCRMRTSDLPFLLEVLGPPLGIGNHKSRLDILIRTKSYCIPEHGAVIHFIETLIPLARQVLMGNVELSYVDTRDQEESWRHAFPDINELPTLRFRQRRCTVDQYFSSTYIAAAYRRTIAVRKYRVLFGAHVARRSKWRGLRLRKAEEVTEKTEDDEMPSAENKALQLQLPPKDASRD
eukprot:TRINITY_DN5161_c0_g1_i1.p1 TRINITY_DN5161_c0_g1~~TRINITY_DN5161_c0_g1_i1.p1  ORF type:complete len:2672 (+),score=931.23 TRINITY_DN5161_c0_g1_i1:185-8200(+)